MKSELKEQLRREREKSQHLGTLIRSREEQVEKLAQFITEAREENDEASFPSIHRFA